jgi:hypothetical protein
LEIDTGASVHLFSAYDLGVPPTDVATVLQAALSTRPTGPSSDPAH